LRRPKFSTKGSYEEEEEDDDDDEYRKDMYYHWKDKQHHILNNHVSVIIVFSLSYSQENCFKRSIKMYIKTAPTCFSANHHQQGVHYLSLLKLRLLK
jgi:hypothetical protein